MKDQNWGRIYGFTDKDYIEELGLDPSLEGKPEINNAIRAKVREQTIQSRIQSGMSEAEARKLTDLDKI